MTREEVKQLLMTMEAIFPNFRVKDPQNTLDVWSTLLGDKDARFINAALYNFVVSSPSEFAPGIGQLIQRAHDMQHEGELTPSEAWATVYKAICNSGYDSVKEFDKLPATVQRAVGSARQLQEWAMDDEFSESVASSNFRRSYMIACEQNRANELLSAEVKNMISEARGKLIEKEVYG